MTTLLFGPLAFLGPIPSSAAGAPGRKLSRGGLDRDGGVGEGPPGGAGRRLLRGRRDILPLFRACTETPVDRGPPPWQTPLLLPFPHETSSATWLSATVPPANTAGRVVTRFPPEPNGYLHIGHAKSICLNFGLAQEYGGVCHLRFDDTNPETEDMEYVEGHPARRALAGLRLGHNLFHASDYFEQLYDFAVELIRLGKAYVDSLTEDEIREYRGTVTEPGRNSPYRDRSVEENLDLLRPHEGRRIPGRRPRAARQDRHGRGEHEDARPAALPHPPRHPLPPGRRLVHLPDVRLRPPALGRHRRDHPLDLHPGVREQPRHLRLAGRHPALPRAAAADRVRPPEPHLHRDEQAQAPAARRAQARDGLGRPAHAHARRPAPPRLHARGDPRPSASASAWPRPTARWT